MCTDKNNRYMPRRKGGAKEAVELEKAWERMKQKPKTKSSQALIYKGGYIVCV